MKCEVNDDSFSDTCRAATPEGVRSPAAGTFQRAAAACTSISRACAAVLRNCAYDPRIVRLPYVPIIGVP